MVILRDTEATTFHFCYLLLSFICVQHKRGKNVNKLAFCREKYEGETEIALFPKSGSFRVSKMKDTFIYFFIVVYM